MMIVDVDADVDRPNRRATRSVSRRLQQNTVGNNSSRIMIANINNSQTAQYHGLSEVSRAIYDL